MNIGNLIKEYREKKGLTVKELSKMLGHGGPQFLHTLEKGEYKVPLEMIGRLIVVLGLPEKQIIKHLVHEFEMRVLSRIQDGKRTYETKP